ncbi:TauD/TfdA dioxygenase family protein [Novosphingobium bradum]|uniref:TauD/TfdA dioxygenase family protein n=1 Tax=Novosphingobium bradum TaxID=1737444 RepID=A0ABV7IRY3_9SPHN
MANDALALTVLKPGFAAEIAGIDARTASDAQIAAIRQASLAYPVLVLPGQELTEDEQARFGERFGLLDVNSLLTGSYNGGLRADLLRVSNADDDAAGPAGPTERRRLLDIGNKFWHTDSSYKPVSAHLSMLYAQQVTRTGGETEFADMRAAHDGLSDGWKALIAGLVAAHSATHARMMLGFDDWSAAQLAQAGVAHDLVRTIPETGRTSLYLSAHASHIVGMPVPIGRMLLHELTELATRPDHVHAHRWRRHDLVIWDNRCTMHRMRRYDSAHEVRALRRVTTLDPAFPARDPATITVPAEVIDAAG